MITRKLTLGVVAASAATMSCSAFDMPAQETRQEKQHLDRDLSLGATGDDVVELQAFLTRYGYLPSAELADSYPLGDPLATRGSPRMASSMPPQRPRFPRFKSTRACRRQETSTRRRER